MEVHHHSHTSRKKWTHYLWEFLMLFLAVTLGFFVENQREHYVEHQREKQYTRSLYLNLKTDTAHFVYFSRVLLAYDRNIDSLMALLANGDYMIRPEDFYRRALAGRSTIFLEYNNSAFEQLKNSGNLRLLRNYGLSDSLTLYDNFLSEKAKRQEERLQEAHRDLTAYMWEILDAAFYKKRTDTILSNDGLGHWRDYRVKNISIEKLDVFKRKKLSNLYFEKKMMIPSLYEMVRDAKLKAANIVSLIEKKYHLSEGTPLEK